MLKEVGASGQISLGKKYARKLFELDFQPDGSILMRPVRVVPANTAVHEQVPAYAAAPGAAAAPDAAREWVAAHGPQIDQYNAWAVEREPYSQRVKRWRENGG
jgi:hypothetical protein